MGVGQWPRLGRGSVLRTVVTVATLMVPLGLAGCSFFKAPFGLGVDDVDLSRPQVPAAIQLSDPQIYSREALVNDRRQELAYLDEVLEDSETQTFGADLARNLRTLEALKNHLSISLDQAQGLAATREEELARRDHEIALLDREITRRERLATLDEPASEDSEEGGGDGGQDAATAEKLAQLEEQTAAQQREIDALKAEREETELEKRLAADIARNKEAIAALKAELATGEGSLVGKVDQVDNVGSSPFDRFRDRQAYRQEIRAARAAVSLDDLHDANGHSLYRLQFRATVLPGDKRDKFGIARVTVEPPELTDDDIRQLYVAWLAHLTSRLNRDVGDGRIEALKQVEVLAASGVFEIARLAYDPNAEPTGDDDRKTGLGFPDDCSRREATKLSDAEETPDAPDLESCSFISVAVPPGAKGSLEELFYHGDVTITKYLESRFERTFTDETEASQFAVRTFGSKFTIEQAQCQIAALVGLATFHGLGEWRQVPEEIRARLAATVRRIEHAGRGCGATGGNNLFTFETSPFAFNIKPFKDALTMPRSWARVEMTEAGKRSFARWVARAGGEMSRGPATELIETDSRLRTHLFLALGRDLESVDDDIATRARVMVDRALRSRSVKRAAAATITKALNDEALSTGSWTAMPGNKDRFKIVSISIAKGEGYTYATGPIERAQRVSTRAAAARSLELSFALSVALQKEGLDVDDTLSYLRETAGRIDALERVPIVVGFSDHHEARAAPSFGWVFGPPVRVKGEDELALRHTVVNHSVFADLSVPGWWPEVNALVETAWAGGWHATGDAIKVQTDRARHRELRKIVLPLNRADLDGLTSVVARARNMPTLRPTSIAYVEPNTISACAETMSFLIYGQEVWRSTEVTLGGLQANPAKIEVLPDMEGVRAEFDISKLPHRAATRTPLSMTVSTRDGSDFYRIRLTGHRTGTNADCGVERAGGFDLARATEKRGAPRIKSLFPSTINACIKRQTFTVVGENLATGTGTAAVLAGATGQPTPSGSDRASQVTFVLPNGFAAGRSIVPFVYVTNGGVSEASVRVTSCTGQGAGTPDALTVEPIYPIVYPGQSFGVVLNGTLSKNAFAKLTLAATQVLADNRTHGSPVTWLADRTKFGKPKVESSGVVYWAKPSLGTLSNGRMFLVTLGYEASIVDGPKEAQSKNLLVHYKNAAATAITVVDDKGAAASVTAAALNKATNDPVTIAFKLPENAYEAFASWGQAIGEGRNGFTLTSHDDAKLSLNPKPDKHGAVCRRADATAPRLCFYSLKAKVDDAVKGTTKLTFKLNVKELNLPPGVADQFKVMDLTLK